MPEALSSASMLTAPITSVSQALGMPFWPIMLITRHMAQP